MKKLVNAATLVALAALVGCQAQGTTGTVGLPGTHSLALVGDLLFVTATDGNELRVLSLSDTARAEFVRAPNPIHPLSIPVADRPIALANDVVWHEGAKGAGRWVYALSANGQELSIVGASRDSLVEEHRLRLSALGVAELKNATITAVGARGQEAGPSTLYLGTFDGTTGRIFQVEVPEVLEQTTNLTGTQLGPDVACGAVRALLVMPEPNKLAFSTSCAAQGSASAFLHDGATLTPLQFTFPTRILMTNPAVEGIPAGRFIYGVYDEQSCGGATTCRGLSAVVGPAGDVAANPVACGNALGDPACDVTGFPMPTIDVGDALIMGADIAPNAPIPNLETPLTGILTTSNGRIVFFDAARLAPKDLDDILPSAGQVLIEGPQVPAGLVSGQNGIKDVLLQPGAARTDIITVEFGAAIPGFTRISYLATAGPNILTVPVDPTNRVRVGDVVEFSQGEGCDGKIGRVDAIASIPGAEGVQHTLTVGPPESVPAIGVQCLLTVRAGLDVDPWVVTGASAGFMGRIAKGGTGAFVWPAADDQWVFEDPNPAYGYDLRLRAYYAHPEGFVSESGEVQPAIRFAFTDPFGAVTPDPGKGEEFRGLRYVLPLDGHFNPAASRIGAGIASSILVNVAGSVAYRPESHRMYVAFPSGDLVVEVEAESIPLGGDITNANPLR